MSVIYKSGEDYLEAVLKVERENGVIRGVDIAKELGVSRGSVSRGLDKLVEKKYLEKETYGEIRLTDLGRKKALDITKKHKALTEFLTNVLGVSPDTAETDACKIEHDLSEETTEKLYEFLKNYTN